MSKLLAASLVLALAACGGSPKASSTMPQASAAPACADVAVQIVGAMAKAIPDLTPEQRERVRVATAEQCTESAWSAEARTCFATITDSQSADGCATKLTDDQKNAFQGRMAAEFQMSKGAETDDDAGMVPPGGGEGGSGATHADPCDGGE